MALGAGSQPVVTKWILDNKGLLLDVAKQAKAIRLEQKAERELALVSKKLGIAQKGVEKTTKGMGGAMTKAAVVAGGLMAVMSKLSAVMGDAAKQALDYEDWIGKDVEAIKGMRTASAGLISDLDLMKARTRLLNGDFALTEKQLQAVTKATIHYTRVNKTEFSDSLKKVTDIITRGTSRGMKDLGINVDLLGKATTKTADAVNLITGRFGDMDIEALNTNERLDQMKNAYNNIVGSIGAAILSSDWFVSAIKRVSSAAQSLMKGIQADSGPRGRVMATGREIGRKQERLRDLRKQARTELSKRKIAPSGGVAGMFGAATHAAMGTKAVPVASAELRAEIDTTKRQIEALKARQGDEQRAWKAINDARTARDEAARKAAKKRADELRRKNAARRRGGSPWGMLSTGELHRTGAIGEGIAAGIGGVGAGLMGGVAGGAAGAGADFSRVTQAVDAEAVSHDAAAAAAKKHADQLAQLAQIATTTDESIQGMVTGSLANLAGGLWAAADAAIQGGEAMGTAVAKMVKATLLGVAQEATVLALFQTAKGIAALATIVTAPLAAGHFAAAAKFGAVAAIAGVGGLAMGAAGVGGGGGGARSTGSSTAAAPSSKVFAKEVVDKRPQFINVYIGDPNSRSAALLMQKELKVATT
jgi:hypothetical protein